MLSTHVGRIKKNFWNRAELVMEVVSPDDPRRDHVVKRVKYARAGIPEYWLVDPTQSAIQVLSLDGNRYKSHGEFRIGERATSVLLPGFGVEVEAVFAAGIAE